ncbi:MAG: hypothetical protein ACI3XG_01205 [Faecousia sp.]
MFTKLLKHEWRATRGMLGILCLICLGASLLGGLTMRYLMWASTVQDMQQNVIIVLNISAMVAAIVAVALAGVAALFLLIGRFYRSRFTDEGYLTFTLPVSTHQNLLSSMVNSAIGMVIMFFAICAAIGIWLMIGFSAVEGFYEALWEFFPRLWAELSMEFGQLKGHVALFLGNVLCSGICEMVVLMLSVTIGSIIAKKHKILAAVGVYYGINVAISIVNGVIMSKQVIADYSGEQIFLTTQSVSMLLMAAISVAGYFLMYWLMDRKLNLN